MNALQLTLENTVENRTAILIFQQAQVAFEQMAYGEIDALLTDCVIDHFIALAKKSPQTVSILHQMGHFLLRTHALEKLEKIYSAIIDVKNDDITAYSLLSFVIKKSHRFNEAETLDRKACAICPNESDVTTTLIGTLLQKGNFPEFQTTLRQVIQCPNFKDPKQYSGCLLNLHYFEQVDRAFIFQAHQKCQQLFKPSGKYCHDYPNIANPNRKLRIGYISPDFNTHSVSWFLIPILRHHNREQFEIFAYSNTEKTDIITDEYRELTDHFKNIFRLSTAEICQLIHDDQIDLLIDLAGHTGSVNQHVIGVLIEKPAPVQVTYLGYPDTTGLPQVDYRITDHQAEAPDAQNYYTEKLVHLKDGFLCYAPPIPCPEIGPLPALENGYVTFGSFNANKKINPLTIQLWSNVLKACENSRLILKFGPSADPTVKNHYLEQFQNEGINPDRIDIYGFLPRQEHMDLYNKIDIALDTYPYHGTTTTCEAFYMGVPIISLIGEHHMSRVGLSLLTRVGMEFFAASTPQEYISKAAALASRPDSLEKIRRSMRTRMTASSLCSPKQFTVQLENAYRTMWDQWCQTKSRESLHHAQNTISVAEIIRPCNSVISTDYQSEPLLTDIKKTQEINMETTTHPMNESQAAIETDLKSNAAQEAGQEKPRKLHIGGKVSHPEWEVLNIQPGPHVDHVGDAADLSQFADETFDELYGSHVLEHFDYKDALLKTLKEWNRVLKPGGKLHISVPDMDILCQFFIKRDALNLDQRFHIMRMLFGGHVDPYDYHYVGLDAQILSFFLQKANFHSCKRVKGLGIFEDTSNLQFLGVPISLNMIAYK